MNWGIPQQTSTANKKPYQVIVESQAKANELVARNSMNLKFCPYKFRTRELCDQALLKNPMCIGYIPTYNLTQDRCDWAVKQNYLAHRFINIQFKTEEMLLYVLNLDPNELFNIPQEIITFNLVKKAVSKDGSIFSRLPIYFKSPELEQVAVKAETNPHKKTIYVSPYSYFRR